MNAILDRLPEFIGNHWIMSSALLIVIVLLIQDFIESAFRKHKTVSATEAVILMNQEGTVVIDVREAQEYADGHIEGARHVPVNRIEERVYELEAHKQDPIIVTCQSGTRAPAACKKLAALGFTQVFEMKGGMLSWEDQKLPVSKKRNK